MNARDALFARLRAQAIEEVPLPAIEGDWIRHGDPRERFRAAVAEASGAVLTVGIGGVLSDVISSLEVMRGPVLCCSFVPMVTGNMDAPGEPHAYRDVDVVVVPAEFGVAENGAVWIDGARVPVRAALFLAQHLVVLLPHGEVIDNMHQAYERLGAGAGKAGYGCFMSGPSKTADIEQALIVGAHGPRSLTIIEY